VATVFGPPSRPFLNEQAKHHEINHRSRNPTRNNRRSNTSLTNTKRPAIHRCRHSPVSQRRPLERVNSLRRKRHSSRSTCIRCGSHMDSSSQQRVAERERSNMTTHWYASCPHCTAKWFSPEPLAQCPRCGSQPLPAEHRTPPWKQQSSNLDRPQDNTPKTKDSVE